MGMKTLITFFAMLLTITSATAANSDWTTDINAAFAKAKKENKNVLVEFTGSDWCAPCKMMRNRVFSKKEFTQQATKGFVLVELDFPQNNRALAEKNGPYAEKFKVAGFPTVILFKSNGQEYSRINASAYPSVDKFLAYLRSSAS